MILWILSIATLSWKLLSPEKKIQTMRTMNRINTAAHVNTLPVALIKNGCFKKNKPKKKNPSLNLTKTPNEAVFSTCLNMVLPPTDTLHAYQMTQKPQLEPGERRVLTLPNTFVALMCDNACFLSVKNFIRVANQC